MLVKPSDFFFLLALILSIQTPVATLMREIAQSVNSSHFNLSEVSERMQHAIEHTVQAAQQVRPPLSYMLYLCG